MVAQQAYTSPRLTASPAAILHGDCLAVLKEMPGCSVDAIVTDPPAGIAFMGKDWDNFSGKKLANREQEKKDDEVAGRWMDGRGTLPYGFGATTPTTRDRQAFISFMSEVFTEALRVIRPGGHAFVWALPRTSHWTATALEDAGWEIREVVVHLFGSGFPKSHNLGDGRGTALKPSNEHWILCRKPLSEPTIAQNVLVHGTGGLNIDKCRVGWESGGMEGQERTSPRISPNPMDWGKGEIIPRDYKPNTQGRWPSNTLFSHTLYCRQTGVKRVRGDGHKVNNPINRQGRGFFGEDKPHVSKGERYNDPDGMETIDAWECDPSCPVRILGEQSGVSRGHKNKFSDNRSQINGSVALHDTRSLGRRDPENSYGDTGTAARYFAQFSPSPDELEVPFIYQSKASKRDRSSNGTVENTHPTCKNTSLMRYLCRLVGVPGGVILDPFMGSGSTGVATLQEGFQFIGIEQSEEYCTIANARIAHALQEAGIAEVQGDGEWECHESCPVRILGEQSGVSVDRDGKHPNAKVLFGSQFGKPIDNVTRRGDTGTAARYFAQFAPDGLWSEIEMEATHGDD